LTKLSDKLYANSPEIRNMFNNNKYLQKPIKYLIKDTADQIYVTRLKNLKKYELIDTCLKLSEKYINIKER